MGTLILASLSKPTCSHENNIPIQIFPSPCFSLRQPGPASASVAWDYACVSEPPNQSDDSRLQYLTTQSLWTSVAISTAINDTETVCAQYRHTWRVVSSKTLDQSVFPFYSFSARLLRLQSYLHKEVLRD